MEFSGKATTTMDRKGRIRIPAKFRKPIEKKYGREVFITSLDGEHIQIFPLEQWRETAKIQGEIALRNPALKSFFIRINRSGIVRKIDRWGRVLIHKELRDKINIQGKIVIEGRNKYLILSTEKYK